MSYIKAIGIIGILTIILAACMPATTPTNPDLLNGAYAVAHYNATANGEPMTTQGTAFRYATDAYTMSVRYQRTSFVLEIENLTADTIRLNYDQSGASIAGNSSRVIPGNASWVSRNNPQPPTVVVPGSTASETVLLTEYMYFSERVRFHPILLEDSPRSALLSVVLELGDTRETINLRFEPK